MTQEPVDHPVAPPNPSLAELRRDLDDDAIVDHFVTDFLDLLDRRLDGLQQLLRRGRLDDSITALLTIETSSLMVGARALAAAAAELRHAVAAADQSAIADLLVRLRAASAETKTLLGGG